MDNKCENSFISTPTKETEEIKQTEGLWLELPIIIHASIVAFLDIRIITKLAIASKQMPSTSLPFATKVDFFMATHPRFLHTLSQYKFNGTLIPYDFKTPNNEWILVAMSFAFSHRMLDCRNVDFITTPSAQFNKGITTRLSQYEIEQFGNYLWKDYGIKLRGGSDTITQGSTCFRLDSLLKQFAVNSTSMNTSWFAFTSEKDLDAILPTFTRVKELIIDIFRYIPTEEAISKIRGIEVVKLVNCHLFNGSALFHDILLRLCKTLSPTIIISCDYNGYDTVFDEYYRGILRNVVFDTFVVRFDHQGLFESDILDLSVLKVKTLHITIDSLFSVRIIPPLCISCLTVSPHKMSDLTAHVQLYDPVDKKTRIYPHDLPNLVEVRMASMSNICVSDYIEPRAPMYRNKHKKIDCLINEETRPLLYIDDQESYQTFLGNVKEFCESKYDGNIAPTFSGLKSASTVLSGAHLKTSIISADDQSLWRYYYSSIYFCRITLSITKDINIENLFKNKASNPVWNHGDDNVYHFLRQINLSIVEATNSPHIKNASYNFKYVCAVDYATDNYQMYDALLGLMNAAGCKLFPDLEEIYIFLRYFPHEHIPKIKTGFSFMKKYCPRLSMLTIRCPKYKIQEDDPLRNPPHKQDVGQKEFVFTFTFKDGQPVHSVSDRKFSSMW